MSATILLTIVTVEPKGTFFVKETQRKILKKFEEDIVTFPEKRKHNIRIYRTCFIRLITENLFGQCI